MIVNSSPNMTRFGKLKKFHVAWGTNGLVEKVEGSNGSKMKGSKRSKSLKVEEVI